MSRRTLCMAVLLAVSAAVSRAPASAAAPHGLTYVPVDPCVLVRTAGSPQGKMGADETRALLARGAASLAAQGGAVAGCGIAEAAAVLAVTLRVANAAGVGQLKVWPADESEPGNVLLDYRAGGPSLSSSVLIELCDAAPCVSDFHVKTAASGAHVRIDALGYFIAGPEAAAGPPGAPGAPGPPGPQGAQGPEGPAGSSCSVTQGGSTSVTISCTDGTSAFLSVGARQFYLTRSRVQGDEALTACAPGYHMASLWEIHDVTYLKYNTALGETQADSGLGPPSAGGWVRTGFTDGGVGTKNCRTWTSSSDDHDGSVGQIGNAEWNVPAIVITPWVSGLLDCSQEAPVWCVQD
jgi:hypothetical protein